MATTPPAAINAKLPDGWTKDLKVHKAIINDEPAFKVGGRIVTYKDSKPKKKILRIGLQLIPTALENGFKPEDFSDPPHWAELVAPTVYCECRDAFDALNTYDRATFSFGLIQFVANTRNDNFHRFLRLALQQLPDAAARYFPELRVHKNKVDLELKDPEQGWMRLTRPADPQNKALCRAIKPLETEINVTEVLFAARMIHWIRNSVDLRNLMVSMVIKRAQDNMKRVGAALDGKGIAQCALIFDILVQGRGGKTKKVPTTPMQKIRAALATKDPFEALKKIRSNEDYQIDRVNKVSKKITERFASSTLTYDLKTGTLK